MNTLNLIRLNLQSPYEVWNDSDDTYFFETDYGVKYPKVKETVICIVEEYFRNNADILLYICETGDNKQAMRNRLFIRWFNEYRFQQNFILRTASVRDGDQDNFAAIIVQRNHPDLDKILTTFEETIRYFTDKP